MAKEVNYNVEDIEDIELVEEFPVKNRERAINRKKTFYKNRRKAELAEIEKERKFDPDKLKTSKNISRKKAENRTRRYEGRVRDY